MARHVDRVEDYTSTFLVFAWVNLMWIFCVLWAVWGMFAVLLLATGLNALIRRIPTR